MSDLSLSQEEIDALLMGGGGGGGTKAAKKSLPDVFETGFGTLLRDAVANQTKALQAMIEGKKITLSAPVLDLVDKDGLLDNLDAEVVDLRVDFADTANGGHGYLLSNDDALALAGPLLGQGSIELNGATVNALEEVASQLVSSLSTALSGKGVNVDPTPPAGQTAVKAMVQTPPGDLVMATYTLNLGNGSNLKLVEFFEYDLVKTWVAAPVGQPVDMGEFMNQSGGRAPAGGPQAAAPAGYPPQGMPGYPPQGMPGYPPQGMPQGMPGYPPQGMPGGYPMPNLGAGYPAYPSVQGIQLPSFSPVGAGSDQGNIGLLMDVTMEVTVELGRAKKQIKEILGMGEGTIIALDKLAGEAVDILVNHKLIAKGEVVVIDENFGVRVTEIVSGADKLNEV